MAVGTGASQIVAASVSSAVGHWRRGNIDMQMGYLLIGGGFFGAITGVKIVYLLKQLGQLDLFVSLTYVILLGVIGSLMLIESVNTLRAAPARTRLGAAGGTAHLDPAPAAQAALSRIPSSTSAPSRPWRSAPSSAG